MAQEIATFARFELERWMATWERRVRFNLCDSGVLPLTANELLELAGASWADVANERLGYGQANGSDELRAAIAARYGCEPTQVLVTTGSAEAIFLLSWMLMERGARVVIPVPTYFQAIGMARNAGAELVPVPYRRDDDWRLDLDLLRDAVTPDTRLVVVANPNNPTGRALLEEERRAIVEQAAAVGAWIIADEMYHGAELGPERTPTFWGTYERIIVTSGVSKAYGLPGLRLGWLVAPPDMARELWWRHDYTVLAPNPMSDRLARLALAAEPRILARSRDVLNRNLGALEAALGSANASLRWRRPDGGAICFVGYDDGPDSEALAERLRADRDVLVAPGDHFGEPRALRVGIGSDPAGYGAALAALVPGLESLLG